MTSFVRTIRKQEKCAYVKEILERTDHFIPLKGRPKRAKPGDFLYLAYHGQIVGRARIDRMELKHCTVYIGADRQPFLATCLVHYTGWQRCPRRVAFKGGQGIKYMDTVGLDHLDAQEWPPW